MGRATIARWWEAWRGGIGKPADETVHAGPPESGPDPRALLTERLAQLGLDPEYLIHAEPEIHRDLLRTCGSCPAWRRCLQDLQRGDVQAGMDAYCPNAPIIDGLIVATPRLKLAPHRPAEEEPPMDWPMSRRVECRATRMHDMMKALDVDGRALARLRQGEVYAEARRRCLSCLTSDVCLHWLANAGPTSSRPTFCPNLPLLEACKRQRP